MTAKIITIFNPKGGSGKTTLTMNLGAALAEKGEKVLILDADPKCSASIWAASAQQVKPFPATVFEVSHAGANTNKEIEKQIYSFDYILIDCMPTMESKATGSSLIASDMALIPFIPSPLDLWSLPAAQNFFELAKTVNKRLKSRLLMNCNDRTNISNEIAHVIEESIEIKLLKSTLSNHNDYRECAIHGDSVLSKSQYSKIQNEVRGLKDEVLQAINEC